MTGDANAGGHGAAEAEDVRAEVAAQAETKRCADDARGPHREPSASATSPPPAASQLALAFAARQLLGELQRGPAQARARPMARQLTATTLDLLHWWFAMPVCRARHENFNPVQRDALLHCVIAHELLGDAHASLLLQTHAPAGGIAIRIARTAPYALHLAPGVGHRWIAQALMVWQWANNATTRSAARCDDRFDDRIRFVRDDAEPAALHARACDSILRHARLFLPPLLRLPFQWWASAQRRADDRYSADPGKRGACALQVRTSAGLEVVLHDTPPFAMNGPECLFERSASRAMRLGAIKLPMLEPLPGRIPPLRRVAQARTGARPRLQRADAALLDRGLTCMTERDAPFAALEPLRRPCMLVVCDTQQQAHAARAHLRTRGVARDAIVAGDHATTHALSPSTRCLVLSLDAAPAVRLPVHARVCVLVRLRTQAPTTGTVDAETRALCQPLLWPEQDYAPSRASGRERAAAGRLPANLIDVLSVVDHPHAVSHYDALLRHGACARRRDMHPLQATGDLMRVGLRADAAAFDIPVPPPCIDLAPFDPGERLSDVGTLLMHRQTSLPCRKSIYPRLGWDAQDGGLRRALLEMAEADPAIERHCLLDPRAHADRHRDILLALGCDARGLVHAVAATREWMFLIELQPSGTTAPRPATPAERALRRWCGHVNALPADARSHRRWCWVRLPAPLFWTHKRARRPLVELLTALAETRMLLPRQSPAAPPCSR